MSEKTITAKELDETLTLVAEAIEKGGNALARMLDAVPDIATTKTPGEWVKLFATENVEQLREMRKMRKMLK